MSNPDLNSVFVKYLDYHYEMIDRDAADAIPIEIKASATYNKSFLKGIDYWRKIQPGTTQSFLIYTGEASFQQQETEIINWKELNKIA